MGTRYSHLGLEERCRLRLMEMGFGFGEIARRLGRHRSTIHREVVRNRCIDAYRPDSADRRAWARKLRGSKIERTTDLRACIEDRLAMGWSPQQIAGRMELENAEHGVSAESIYRYLYSPVGRRTGLPRQLAQRKAKRGRRRRNGRREPSMPNRTPIHQRPTKAHLRSEFGHWEGDLMHFRRQRDILLDAAGAQIPPDIGAPSSQQGRRCHRRRHFPGTEPAAREGATDDHLRQWRRVRPARGGDGGDRTARFLLRPAQPVATRRHRKR